MRTLKKMRKRKTVKQYNDNNKLRYRALGLDRAVTDKSIPTIFTFTGPCNCGTLCPHHTESGGPD